VRPPWGRTGLWRLWHDRLRDLALQLVVLGTLGKGADVLLAQAGISYPVPPVWMAIGGLVGAGNWIMCRKGADLPYR